MIKPNCVVSPQKAAVVTKRMPYFLYVGRLSAEKGILPFLKMVKHLGFEVIVVGDGPDRSEIERIASQSNHIRYLGFQDKEQVRVLMSTASALIVPSICYEGMPLTILEAYSAGIPVLANNLGALPEIVEEGVTGSLFNLGNPNSVVKVLSDWSQLLPEQQERIYSNCIRYSQDHFDPSVVTRQMIDTYRALISVRGNS